MRPSVSIPRLLPIPAAIRRSFALLGGGLLLPGLGWAGPSGGVVVGGQATIGNPTPNGTVINQSTNRAIIDWQQFSIGGNEYVQFVQPSASSVALNRVIGGSPSEIFGSLLANGRVFLINPNGVLFAPGAQVDVGGLVASTLDISNQDFMAGRYVFTGGSAPGAAVTNAGAIKAADGGFVVLSGDRVENSGLIQARLGQVVLASGSAMTLDLDGDGLISFAVDRAALAQHTGVTNSGELLADGGRVLMTAATARDLVGSAVNNSGLVRAQGIAEHDGQIELTASGGGDIENSGTLDASNAAGDGGSVALRGDHDIALADGARILAEGGAAGHGGDIRVIAGHDANIARGALISATGGTHGGLAELSGHGSLHLFGTVSLGRGGQLVIDPTNITIAAGSGSSGSASGDATVYQNFIESQLDAGTNVTLAATNSITLADLGAGGALDGTACTTCGSLTLGIGSIATNPANGLGLGSVSFVRGAGVSGGGIRFANTSNSIKVGGDLSLIGGSQYGVIDVGGLSARNIDLTSPESVQTGDLHAGGFLDVFAGGDITVGKITGGQGLYLYAGSGDIATGDIGIANTGSGYSAGGTALTLDAAGGSVDTGFIHGSSASSYATLDVEAANGIHVRGDIQLSGGGGSGFVNQAANPMAQATLHAGNSVTVDGGITLTATAFNGSGSGSITDRFVCELCQSFGGFHLDSGHLSMGAVALSIRTDSSEGSAQVGGPIDLEGVGLASATIETHAFSAGTITIDAAHGGAVGHVSGVATQSGVDIGGSSYQVTRTIDGGSPGSDALFAHASLDILTQAGSDSVSLQSITLRGAGASATLSGPGQFAVSGNLTLDGLAAPEARYRETVQFAGSTDAAPLRDATTTYLGDATQFQVGDGSTSAASLHIGGTLAVSGRYLAGAQIHAADLALGGVSIAAASGSFQSDDPTLVPAGTVFNAAGDAYFAAVGDATPLIGNVNLSAQNDVVLGLSASGLGSVTVNAGNLITSSLPGVVTLGPPLLGYLRNGYPDSGNSGSAAPATNFGAPQLNAQSIALAFGNSMNFAGWTLDAAQTLSLTGNNGAGIIANGMTLTGGNAIDLATTGAVNLNGSQLNSSTADGAVTIDAGSLSLDGATLNGHDLDLSSTLSFTLPTTTVLNGTNLSLTSGGTLGIGGNLNFAGDVNLSGTGVNTQDLQAANIAVTSGSGGVQLGTLTATQAVTVKVASGGIGFSGISGQDVTLSSGADLTLTSAQAGAIDAGDTLNVQAGGALSASSLSLYAPHLILGAGTTLDLTGVTLAAGTSSAADSIALAADTVNLAGGALHSQTLNIDAGHDVTLSNTVAVNVAQSIDIASTNGSVAVGTALATSSGDIDVSAAHGGATLADVTAGGAANLSTGTTLAVGKVIAVDGLSLSAGGDITAQELATGGVNFETAPVGVGDVNLTSSGGAVTTGDIYSTGNIFVTAAHGVSVGDLTGGLGSGSAARAIVLSAGDGVQFGKVQFGDDAAPGGISVQAGSGDIQGGAVTVNGGARFDAGGAVTLGDVSTGTHSTTVNGSHFTGIAITAGGNAQTGALTAEIGDIDVQAGGGVTAGNLAAVAGNVALNAAAGAILAGQVQALALSANSTGGGQTYGDVTLGSGGYSGSIASAPADSGYTFGNVVSAGSFEVNAVADQFVHTGNIGAQTIALHADGGSIATGDLAASAGAVNASAASGDVGVGAVSASGDVQLVAQNGHLAFGNVSGDNLTLSAGQDLDVGSVTLSAAGELSLASTAGALSLNATQASGQTLALQGATDLTLTGATLGGPGGGVASEVALTAGSGKLDLSGSQILAQNFAAQAGGDIVIADSTIADTAGGGGRALRARAAASGYSLSAGGAISFSQARLNAHSDLSLQGADIHIDDGSALGANAVHVTASGAVDGSGAPSTLDANAVSMQANSIDLSSVALTVGNGTADFGADPGLLTALGAVAPALLPASGAPNAAFSAPGGVTLGSLDLSGGYLYIQAPTLTLPSANAANAIFLDFQPTDPAAVLTLSGVPTAAGIATIVYGGSLETADLHVGDGVQFFNIRPQGTNYVFASRGTTFYPDSIGTNGRVIVLGAAVLRTPEVNGQDLPVLQDLYDTEFQGEGVLGYDSNPGDVNDDGVSHANRGLIDQKTSSQPGLSCGLGGAP
ncbi:MAG: filamentous hemagglutinin N-terminal domain-containing protein [Sinobacteraceae bacterium]|nr:filamentous hemagglutinin N-terminal domain-containing protein [Nevskiaceae bacterium]